MTDKEANEIIKSYEGLYTVTMYPIRAWAAFVVADRDKDVIVDYCKTQMCGNQVGETFKAQFYLCLAYAQGEARKRGKTVHDIKKFHGSIDPIYQCIKTLLIEWTDGSNTSHDYSLYSSKDMQYKQ